MMDGSINHLVNHTICKIYQWISEGALDLNSRFQRGEVWGEREQSFLIDTIIEKYYIPPLIFSVHRQNNNIVRVCIDGKQRLIAIKKFMNNEIAHVNTRTGVKTFYNLSSDSCNQFLDDDREKFSYSELECVEYYDLTLEEEHEIFKRIQLGRQLTIAEKLQTITTPMADFIYELITLYPEICSMMSHSSSRPFRLFAHVVFLLENEPTKFWISQEIINEYINQPQSILFHHDFKQFYIKLFNKFTNLIELNEHSDLLREITPTEFIFICWLLKRHNSFTKDEYFYWIDKMKRHARKKFNNDIRLTPRIYNSLRKFILNINCKHEENCKHGEDDESNDLAW
ncbi:hypothetical protein C1645_751890 [Glomus cerebriforme]|uniref:GmrSD restriction endonucleases N-terminal domain-containing protein n=1 Tax=Glomus cerebriforme TaxID=658196 RepID=A0A397TRS1_9GLOM|nr:hypothetical protein C1645_751890 [Glomus cerebriforme]